LIISQFGTKLLDILVYIFSDNHNYLWVEISLDIEYQTWDII